MRCDRLYASLKTGTGTINKEGKQQHNTANETVIVRYTIHKYVSITCKVIPAYLLQRVVCLALRLSSCSWVDNTTQWMSYSTTLSSLQLSVFWFGQFHQFFVKQQVWHKKARWVKMPWRNRTRTRMRTRIRTIIRLLLLLLLLLPSTLPMLMSLLMLLLLLVFFKVLETYDCCLRCSSLYVSVFQFRPGPLYLFDSLDRKNIAKDNFQFEDLD